MATALVVDDSSAMRMILRKNLEEIGFDVREAGNGTGSPLPACEGEEPISLSLLDWNMPEMNGFELLQKVAGIAEFNSMVIIMVTAETELEHIADALEAGANEYVMKPFTRDILVGKLELAGIRL